VGRVSAAAHRLRGIYAIVDASDPDPIELIRAGDAEAYAAINADPLVRRYLEGFGPASVADMAQFALVQRPRIREALTSTAISLPPYFE